MHLIQTLFPAPWRACPVWVGVYWTERIYPRMRIELMTADETEATAWLLKRTPKAARINGPDKWSLIAEACGRASGCFE
jgi:hypothetical protein